MSRVLKKLNDSNFVHFISDFDILLFTETWHCKTTHIYIERYDYYSCPRPNFSRNAKRSSGGVIVYYKSNYDKYISLVETNSNGYTFIWFK